ncbi:hypothetical protein ONZ45_g15498 [Pleurotus djamor]|nr:hypothetical protein ONZ45_g15498 [Pleurotus djamor]
MDSLPKTIQVAPNDHHPTAFHANHESITEVLQSVHGSVINSAFRREVGELFQSPYDTIAGAKIQGTVEGAQAQEGAEEGFNIGRVHGQPTPSSYVAINNTALHDISCFGFIHPATGVASFPIPCNRSDTADYVDEVGFESPIFSTLEGFAPFTLFQPAIGVPNILASAVQYGDVSSEPLIMESRLALPPDVPQAQRTFHAGSTYEVAGDEQMDLGGERVETQFGQRVIISSVRVHAGFATPESRTSVQPPDTPWLRHSNAGSHSEANPISGPQWNNGSIDYPTDVALSPTLYAAAARMGDTVLPDHRRVKKQAADRSRNRAREEAKKSLQGSLPQVRDIQQCPEDRTTGKGMTPVASTEWHNAYADQQTESRFFVSE